MSAPPSRSPSSSRASAHGTTTPSTATPAQNALLGATLAFSRAPHPHRTKTSWTPAPSSAGSNGALAAAAWSTSSSSSSAHRGGSAPLRLHSQAPQPAGAHSLREVGLGNGVNMPQLPLPQETRAQRGTSPSQQAAVLAAARAPTLSGASRNSQRLQTANKAAVPPKPRRFSQHYTDAAVEKTPIPPTTTLVDLFEQRSKEAQNLGNRPDGQTFLKSPIGRGETADSTLKSPKPEASFRGRTEEKVIRPGITSMFQLELPEARNIQQTKEHKTNDGRKKRRQDKYDGHSSSDESFASASEDLNVHNPVFPNFERPTPGQTLKMENESERQTDVDSLRSRAAKEVATKLLPIVPLQPRGDAFESLPGRSATKPIPIKPQLLQRDPSGGRIADERTPHDALSVSSSHSLKSIPAQFHQAYPRRMTPLTTGDDLANALVASSLASSRAVSPARQDKPPPQVQKKLHQSSKFSFSRTPSPAKGGMLHTLRKADSSSESEDDDNHPYGKHRKRRLVRKHPNKHHEGDRKRWRDAVTVRERKRYEGVWAANRGLHCSFSYEEQDFFKRAPMHQRALQTKAMVNEQVSNIVAREIWSRSRLPETTLEVVWDLVDNNSVGRLQKEEFVVGMWLIDQRLKGRKLPVKVSETVWASVRGIQGIKIRR